jgi:hypothetical protein
MERGQEPSPRKCGGTLEVEVEVEVAVEVGVGPDVEYVITSRGALPEAPSKLVANFRPHAEPVPLTISERLFPDCQSERPTTSWITGPISASEYQVFAFHWEFVLSLTLLLVSVRWDGRLEEEKVGLLAEASAAL